MSGSGASRDFRPFGVLSPQNYRRDHFRKRCIFRDFAICNRTRFLILNPEKRGCVRRCTRTGCRFLGEQGRNQIEGYGILGQDEAVLGV